MSLCRILLRSLKRSSPLSPTTINNNDIHRNPNLLSIRYFAFSSAEEAAAERRRRKRRLRIEPPLHALRRDPTIPRPRPDPNAPRLPDSTSALVGPRLNLHNRVQSLIRSGNIDSASATARQSVFSNIRPTVFTCNAIIAAMYRSGRFDDAIALFHYFFNQSKIIPNVVSYNVLINTHCDAGRVDVALDVYRHILDNAPFTPSYVTYRHLTKGLVDAGRIAEAVDLLREMLNKGQGADSLVYNNLIAGFLNLDNLERALEFFDELRERCLVYDGIVHATLMDWYFKRGREKEAMDSYGFLLERQFKMSPITCNTLLEVLLKYEKRVEAFALFDKMLDSHTPPNFHGVNTDSYKLMMNDCFRLGKFSDAIEVFKKTGTKQGSKPFAMDVAGFNNIIGNFLDNGLVAEAQKLFEEMSVRSVTPDVTTYSLMENAYFREGEIDNVLQFLNRMVVGGDLKIDVGFCNKVFDELTKKGKIEEVAEILGRMGETEVKPDPTSYEIVIMGLCNEGKLDRGLELLNQVVKNGIVITPNLHDSVLEAFGKVGRSNEIERLFEVKETMPAYTPQPDAPRFVGQVAAGFRI